MEGSGQHGSTRMKMDLVSLHRLVFLLQPLGFEYESSRLFHVPRFLHAFLPSKTWHLTWECHILKLDPSHLLNIYG